MTGGVEGDGEVDAVIAGRIILLPLLLAKGLEFDTVIAVDAFAGAAKGTAADRRRLYLCATRALHSLTFVEGDALPEVYKTGSGIDENRIEKEPEFSGSFLMVCDRRYSASSFSISSRCGLMPS